MPSQHLDMGFETDLTIRNTAALKSTLVERLQESATLKVKLNPDVVVSQLYPAPVVHAQIPPDLGWRALAGRSGKPNASPPPLARRLHRGRVGGRFEILALFKLHHDVVTLSGATILGDVNVGLILDVAHPVAVGQQQEAQMRAAG